MQIEPYPIQLDMQVREQEKLHMIAQWHLGREAGEARSGVDDGVWQAVSGTASTAADTVRSWFARPSKPQEQCC